MLCVSAGVTDLRLCFVRCRPFRTQTERWKRISSGARSCVRSGVRECIRRVGGAPRPSALSCGCVGVRAIDNALCHKKMHTAGTRRWILCDVFLYRGKPSIVVRVFPRLRVCNIDKSIGINHPPPQKKRRRKLDMYGAIDAVSWKRTTYTTKARGTRTKTVKSSLTPPVTVYGRGTKIVSFVVVVVPIS